MKNQFEAIRTWLNRRKILVIMPGTVKPGIPSILALLVSLGSICLLSPTYQWDIDAHVLPPVEAPLVAELPSAKMPSMQVERFLEADFSLVKNVESLPAPVLRGLRERGGSCVMGNPREPIPPGCIFSGYSFTSRLVFAGISRHRGFLHYEGSGGIIGIVPYLVLFTVDSGEARPIWRGYCRSVAKNVDELRSWVANGTCVHQFPGNAVVQPPVNPDGKTVFARDKSVIPLRFTYVISDEPTCNLPAAEIEIRRYERNDLSLIDPSIYSELENNSPKLRIDPTTCQYIYDLPASALLAGTYQVFVITKNQADEDSRLGYATLALVDGRF